LLERFPYSILFSLKIIIPLTPGFVRKISSQHTIFVVNAYPFAFHTANVLSLLEISIPLIHAFVREIPTQCSILVRNNYSLLSVFVRDFCTACVWRYCNYSFASCHC
jgi:hypothetical protein